MARPKKEKIEEPEVVADGVVREVGENPLEDNPMEKKPRASGNWKKVSYEEMAALEMSGKLVGYDPSTGEVLVK